MIVTIFGLLIINGFKFIVIDIILSPRIYFFAIRVFKFRFTFNIVTLNLTQKRHLLFFSNWSFLDNIFRPGQGKSGKVR